MLQCPTNACIGCRSCRARRLHCDRTLPHCIKCKRKGITCPGYGIELRWTNSVASRGRFKGHPAPTNTEHDQPSPPPPPKAFAISARDSPTPNSSIYDGRHDYTNDYTQTDTSIRNALEFEHTPESALDECVRYYAAEIAPLNVWIHSKYNGYSRFVIPLVKAHPMLKLAIVGIAAAHQPRLSANAGPRFAQWACQKALLLITRRVRKLTDVVGEANPCIEGESDSSEAALAATLVLCNYSLLQSDISLALFHLQAARVLIRTLSTDRSSSDDTFAFLKDQVAGLDVVACTTLFNADYIRDAVLPEPVTGVFGQFLHIIHRITMRSIEDNDNDRSHGYHFSSPDLQDEFNLAHGASLMAAGCLVQESSDSYRRDVTRLIQSFHHAGLLYACKRVRITDAENVERQNVCQLFRLLDKFEDINACIGNLSWPLFMGGISVCKDDAKKRVVRSICLRLSTSSSYKYYANILTFLEELWVSEQQDWAVIARDWENKSRPILAV